MKPAALLLAALLAVALAAPTFARDDPRVVREQFATLAAAKDYQAILRLSEEVFGWDRLSVPAWEYRAYALQQLRRSGPARAAYEQLLQLSPDHVWGLTNYGGLLADGGHTEKAQATLERAVALAPGSAAARGKLVDVLKERHLYSDAGAQIRAALEHDADPLWAHRELAYVDWVNHAPESSRKHWKAARALGADDAECAYGLGIVLFDQTSLPAAAPKAAAVRRRRTGDGEPWTLRFGAVEVVTRVGPRLPDDVTALLRDLPARYAALFELPGFDDTKVRVHLSRTLEEHERHRRLLFPLGPRDKAFMVRNPRQRAGGGRRGRWPGGVWDLDLYVAWSTPGFRTGLTHELAHAVLQAGGPNLPSWLDEGLATYLEAPPGADDPEPLGRNRPDLLGTLRDARAQDGLVPLRTLTSPFGAFQGGGARLRYAQSWSLVRFLIHHRGRSSRESFKTMLAAYRERPGPPTAPLIAEYGDLAKIEKAWHAYVAALLRKL